jgi:hypothetical protein
MPRKKSTEPTPPTTTTPVERPANPTPCKSLDEWLEQHQARCAWQRKVGTATTEAWLVGDGVAIVQRFGKDGVSGWGLYTQAPGNSIESSLRDAEERLGLLPPSPGVVEDGRRGVVYWKQEGNDTTEDAGPADLWRADDSNHGEMAVLFGARFVSASTAERYAKKHGHEFRPT